MKISHFFKHHWLGSMSALALLPMSVGAADESVYRMAVVPQFTAVEISKNWQPVLDKITELSGVKLELYTYPKIPIFEQSFKSGEADFAYMNPYHVVMANDAQGYIPLVRDKALLNGILVVKKDSGIQSLAQLEGKKIAFPAPNAFGASLWMRAQLTQTHAIHFEESYVGSHQTVYRQVVTGDVQAGGGIQSTLDKESDSLKDELSILYRTPDVPSHPIVYHPRVSADIANKVKTAFMTLAQTEEGQALLKPIQMTHPVDTHYEQEYLALKTLKLETFVK
jgi:phosphonate transport system substrate-binding protein